MCLSELLLLQLKVIRKKSSQKHRSGESKRNWDRKLEERADRRPRACSTWKRGIKQTAAAHKKKNQLQTSLAPPREESAKTHTHAQSLSELDSSHSSGPVSLLVVVVVDH